jgi:chromosome segregation ATPase
MIRRPQLNLKKRTMESLSQITEEKKKIEELTAEYEAKLEESLKEKQSLEENLKEKQSLEESLQQELVKLREENKHHQNNIADLNLQLSTNNDMHSQLETQLKEIN